MVNTHLEIGGLLASDQEGQAKNLVDALAPLAGQVILAGDFNSPADGSGTTSYQTVTQAFTDAWPVVNATDPGLTCCTDITAAALSPNERIDSGSLSRQGSAGSRQRGGPGRERPHRWWAAAL